MPSAVIVADGMLPVAALPNAGLSLADQGEAAASGTGNRFEKKLALIICQRDGTSESWDGRVHAHYMWSGG